MELLGNLSDTLHRNLKDLLAIKSKRDRVNFTMYQLAKLLDMPHSMLVKLMHHDATKRVSNPRIETLARIVAFFKADGFNVTIDDLLTGCTNKSVGVREQEIGKFYLQQDIPLYSFDSVAQANLGSIDIKLTATADSANIIALYADEDIKPMFKKGSIFVLDTCLKPENDTLVAIKLDHYTKLQIRKLYRYNNTAILESYNPEEKNITLMPTMRYHILGVVIQINAKT